MQACSLAAAGRTAQAEALELCQSGLATAGHGIDFLRLKSLFVLAMVSLEAFWTLLQMEAGANVNAAPFWGGIVSS